MDKNWGYIISFFDLHEEPEASQLDELIRRNR
jgi:hypothetical protein